MKLNIEIKNRFTGKIIFAFETENNTVAKTINEYVRQSRADLTDADLTDADLTDANLTDADLTDANLTDANLTDADLTGADLTRADLTRADLTRADLTDADLTDANLTDANLTGADLTGADLTSIKMDFFGRMLLAKNEIPALREKLLEGKINGSSYEGECCCFVGTVANNCNTYYANLPLLKPDFNSPTERWFMGINPGHTPENNQKAKITLGWIDQFLELIK